MQLNLNEVQEMIQDNARRFFATELDPEKIRAIEASADGHSREHWARIAELGWNSLSLPESAGGGGLGVLELCILAEEAGRAAASTPLLISSGLAARCLQSVPSSDVATELLNRLATSDCVISAALLESGARDERAIPSMELQESSGSVSLSGSKLLVPYASVADVLLVSARGSQGEPAIVAVDTSIGGLEFNRHSTLGGDPLFQVMFSDVVVPEHCVLARGKDTVEALDSALETATLLSLAEAVGNCEGILQLTTEYAKIRKQFGQAIGSFQAVSHPIADMRIEIDALHLLTLEAAWLLDQGEPASMEIASTKVLANEAVARLALDGHRLHGAIGYSNEYDLQLYTRRAKAFSVAWGVTDSQVERAARALGI